MLGEADPPAPFPAASVLEELKKEEGRVLEVSTTAAGKVRWLSESAASQNHAASLEAAATERPGDPLEGVSLCSTAWCGQWCVGAEGGPSTGAKSQSIATLRAAVPEWAKVPASVTVPFGAFEQSLEDPGALEVKRELAENLKVRAAWSAAARKLLKCGRDDDRGRNRVDIGLRGWRSAKDVGGDG